MSLLRRPLNACLRLTEKRMLARADSPVRIRNDFERKARVWFGGPRGVAGHWETVAGREALRLVPPGAAAAPLLLYFHGGAYFCGSPDTHRAMLAALCRRGGLPALLPRYRLAPEHPFPAAFEDARAVWRAVADHPGGVILGGDSAGGGLAVAVLAEALRSGGPVPLACFAFSPLTDMSFSGDSLRTNATREALLPVARLDDLAGMVLAGADPRDPRASPLFADFHGAPPVWLAASDSEVLLDDTRRLAARMRAQGVTVTERIEHGLPHVWPIFQALLPEARATLDALALWLRSLSPPPAGS